MKNNATTQILKITLLTFFITPLNIAFSGDIKESSLDLEEIKSQLSPIEYHVTQEGGTERAFNNRYNDHNEVGIYVDVVSGEALFSSLDKYDSKSGWPSFTQSLTPLVEKKDRTFGMSRIEIRSKKADSHLGHLFNDGPKEQGGLRYCVNSASLRFIPLNQMKEEGYEEYLYLFKRD